MRKHTPKVSIAMTCYNCSRFVSQAIQSVNNQTFTDWGLVIVDDASTDKSIEVINQYILKNKINQKCEIFKHERNFGYGKTLKDAIDFSRGELVAVVDADDVISKNVIALVVRAHDNHPEASLVYTNYMVCGVSLNNIRLVKNFQIPEGKTYMNFMKGVSHLKCFKKSFYNKTIGLDPTLVKSVDKDLIFKLEEVGKLVYVDTIGYFYREHRDNLSNAFFRKPEKERLEIKQSRDRIIENAHLRRKNSKEMTK
jgi:glycosyltransferase involved in cell wall biosynthesis